MDVLAKGVEAKTLTFKLNNKVLKATHLQRLEDNVFSRFGTSKSFIIWVLGTTFMLIRSFWVDSSAIVAVRSTLPGHEVCQGPGSGHADQNDLDRRLCQSVQRKSRQRLPVVRLLLHEQRVPLEQVRPDQRHEPIHLYDRV